MKKVLRIVGWSMTVVSALFVVSKKARAVIIMLLILAI